MLKMLLLISILISVNCKDDQLCDEAMHDMCCNTYPPVMPDEAEVRQDKNLRYFFDVVDGCRWIFKSKDLECCFANDTQTTVADDFPVAVFSGFTM